MSAISISSVRTNDPDRITIQRGIFLAAALGLVEKRTVVLELDDADRYEIDFPDPQRQGELEEREILLGVATGDPARFDPTLLTLARATAGLAADPAGALHQVGQQWLRGAGRLAGMVLLLPRVVVSGQAWVEASGRRPTIGIRRELGPISATNADPRRLFTTIAGGLQRPSPRLGLNVPARAPDAPQVGLREMDVEMDWDGTSDSLKPGGSRQGHAVFSSADDLRIERCGFSRIAGDAIYAYAGGPWGQDGAAPRACERVVVHRCDFSEIGRVAVNFAGARNSIVVDNDFVSRSIGPGPFFKMEQNEALQADNNIVVGNRISGGSVNASRGGGGPRYPISDLTIRANAFSDLHRAGGSDLVQPVTALEVDGLTIEENTFEGTFMQLSIISCRDVRIWNNTFTGHDGTGVNVGASALVVIGMKAMGQADQPVQPRAELARAVQTRWSRPLRATIAGNHFLAVRNAEIVRIVDAEDGVIHSNEVRSTLDPPGSDAASRQRGSFVNLLGSGPPSLAPTGFHIFNNSGSVDGDAVVLSGGEYLNTINLSGGDLHFGASAVSRREGPGSVVIL